MKGDAYLEERGWKGRRPGICQMEHFLKQVSSQELERTLFLAKVVIQWRAEHSRLRLPPVMNGIQRGRFSFQGTFLLEQQREAEHEEAWGLVQGWPGRPGPFPTPLSLWENEASNWLASQVPPGLSLGLYHLCR